MGSDYSTLHLARQQQAITNSRKARDKQGVKRMSEIKTSDKLTILKSTTCNEPKLNTPTYNDKLDNIQRFFFAKLGITDNNIENEFSKIKVEDIINCLAFCLEKDGRNSESIAKLIRYAITSCFDEMIESGYTNQEYIYAKADPSENSLIKTLNKFIASQNLKKTCSTTSLLSEEIFLLINYCDNTINNIEHEKIDKVAVRLICKLMAYLGMEYKHIKKIKREQLDLTNCKIKLEYKIIIDKKMINHDFNMLLPKNLCDQLYKYINRLELSDDDLVFDSYATAKSKIDYLLRTLYDTNVVNVSMVTKYATIQMLLNDIDIDIIQTIRGDSINCQNKTRYCCEKTIEDRLSKLDNKLRLLELFDHI